jgi:cold shock CspA family protein
VRGFFVPLGFAEAPQYCREEARRVRYGDRHCEVVQSDKRLWIQSAARRRQRFFVHISAVERAGLNTLNEGQQIEYEEVSDRGKTSAQNLKVK